MLDDDLLPNVLLLFLFLEHKQNDNNRDNQSHSNQIPPRAPLACFDADDDLDEDNADWETEE